MKPASFSILQTILVAGFALTLAGCEVGPDYEKPETTMPPAWTSAADPSDAKAQIDQQWWKNFNDPVLTKLIDKADAQNFDLKIAEARIAEARANESSAFAALLPSGDVKGTATREANQIAFPDAQASGLGPLLHKPFNEFQTGFDASWELDLFGGNRRADEAADAQMQASEASRDDGPCQFDGRSCNALISIFAARRRSWRLPNKPSKPTKRPWMSRSSCLLSVNRRGLT